MDNGKVYTLNNNLRILDDGVNQIVFRIGLWNYNEAILELSDETEEFKTAIRSIVSRMESGIGFRLDDVDKYTILQEDKENVVNTLEALYTSGVICSKEEEDLKEELNKILLGDFRYIAGSDSESDKKKILFIGDNSYEESTAKELSKIMALKLDICSEELKTKFIKFDLTSNLDALSIKENMEQIKEELRGYDCILLCMQKINVGMYRNLNRVAIYENIPVTTAFVDGPFINIMSIKSPKTGCLECFEQRVLSRMQDHVLYHKFASSGIKTRFSMNNAVVPLLNILTNLLVSEGFLTINSGSSKFEGRVLSIFIPTLEIQVQDLLRVPFCPACGNISKAKLQEMNISARTIMNNIIEDINS